MTAEAWAEQYEAWLGERESWLAGEDDIPENECPMCHSEVDTDYRYCRECQEII